MDDLTIKGAAYKVGRLSAMTQFHVARRLVLVLAALAPHVGKLTTYKKMEPAEKLEFVLGMIPVVGPAFALLSDDDSEFVIYACYAVTERQQNGAWAHIYRNGQVMFNDIDFPSMLLICFECLLVNMQAFFPTGVPTGSSTTPRA